jgi:hypothetical protein
MTRRGARTQQLSPAPRGAPPLSARAACACPPPLTHWGRA